jgi:6-phosphogluconolactonase
MKPQLLFSLMAIAAGAMPVALRAEDNVQIWIGTYSQRGSAGIYSLRMNPETGALDAPTVAAKADNPSFLALRPDRKTMYAVNETGRFEGKPVGAVVSFEVDAKAGTLKELNRQPTGGAAPCHLNVDPSGKCLVVANYVDGNAAAFPIAADGKLEPMSQLVKHEGHGPNAGRQKSPHAHGVTYSPAGDIVFVPDLGIDKIMAYKLDTAKGSLSPLGSATGSVEPGSGPRHIKFNPAGTFAYSINEIVATVSQFSWDAAGSELKLLRSVPSLPAAVPGNTSAELAIHPSGKFLYASNRGHDSIAVFTLDEKSGEPKLIQNFPSGGRAPRCFALDPSGKFLLAANQETDNIVVLKIDGESGKLSDTSFSTKIPAPVCVLFQ